MSAASDCSDRLVRFPDLARWHQFLRRHDVAPSFDRPDLPVPEQAVKALTIWRDNRLVALACLYPLSRETGAWVRADAQREGLACRALAGVLPYGTPPFYARVASDNPDGDAMRQVLTKVGFMRLARNDDHDVWVLRAAIAEAAGQQV